MLLTPIVATQFLNLVLSVVVPIVSHKLSKRFGKKADKRAADRRFRKADRDILRDLEYDTHGGAGGSGGARRNTLNDALLSNAEQERYIGTDEGGQLKLAAKARDILYECDLDPYARQHLRVCAFINAGVQILIYFPQ